MPQILIVEDDDGALAALTVMVEGLGFSATTAGDWAEARAELARGTYDLALLDVVLPGGSGIDLLLELPAERRPSVILMSGDPSVRQAFSALPFQELYFVAKPVERKALSDVLARIRRRSRNGATTAPAPEPGLERLRGDSPAMERLRAMIAKVAPEELSVYIEGESGTGKELVARAIHELSRRKSRPFVALNCAALPENLIDSELFGHVRGAFTGAAKDKEGLFQQAQGGTLLLDEVAEMPMELQARLLRALESSRIRPVGGEGEVEIDVRIIAATNRPFEQAIADGRFREDLFHRLCVFPIVTPPLREREDDVLMLAETFRSELARDSGRDKRFGEEVKARLRSYDWPGNVRQLRNAVQRAFVMADAEITVDCLPPMVVGRVAAQPRVRAGSDALQLGVGMTIAEAERRLIEATLAKSSGDKRRAAEVLGVSLRTLYNRLKEYDADLEPEASA